MKGCMTLIGDEGTGMVEQMPVSTHNEVSGSADGTVVQAGAVHGPVTIRQAPREVHQFAVASGSSTIQQAGGDIAVAGGGHDECLGTGEGSQHDIGDDQVR
jgi:hypothetical protein